MSKGVITLVTFYDDSIMRYEIADLNEDIFSWPTLENLIFDDEYDAKDAARLLTLRGILDIFEANKILEDPIVSTWINMSELKGWLPNVC